jgi:hypothetical protein
MNADRRRLQQDRESVHLTEKHHAVGVGAEAVVLDAPDVGGLGEALGIDHGFGYFISNAAESVSLDGRD